jgi:hypothetical protein
MGNYKTVVAEQLALLSSSGLTAVDLSHVGKDLAFVQDQAERFGVSLRIVADSKKLNRYELPALEHVHQLAHEGDTPVLYFHTKGVSKPKDEGRAVWRRIMGEYVVRGWRANCSILRLEPADVVGVNWHQNPQHFSGNFWCATAEHLRRLPPISQTWRDRFSAEWWVGCATDIRPVSLLVRDFCWWALNHDWQRFLADYCPHLAR